MGHEIPLLSYTSENGPKIRFITNYIFYLSSKLCLECFVPRKKFSNRMNKEKVENQFYWMLVVSAKRYIQKHL